MLSASAINSLDLPNIILCSSVCNSSTSYIWDQLVANTKPREDVEFMRRNIIINRLKLKPLNNQNEFPFPIQEIEVYNQKLHLQEKVKHLKKVVEEKRAKVQKLSRTNKIKCKLDNISNCKFIHRIC